MCRSLIQACAADELAILAYCDWLEEQGINASEVRDGDSYLSWWNDKGFDAQGFGLAINAYDTGGGCGDGYGDGEGSSYHLQELTERNYESN